MNEGDDAVQWREVRRWFAKAEGDLRLSRLALDADPPIVDGAAYHCQQAAEKILKALMIAARRKVPKTHDMRRLTRLVQALHPALAEKISHFSTLTSWGIETRYPELSQEMLPGRREVEVALKRCAALLKAAAALAPREAGKRGRR